MSVIFEFKTLHYFHFSGHSLNLVGQSAAECCPAAVAFFMLVEEIYVFFTASTRRYELLTESLHRCGNQVCVLKRINTTRWSCRADATKALMQGYSQIASVLEKLSSDEDEMPEVRCKANGLHERMCMLETGIYTVFWNHILERFNCTSKLLQDSQLDLNSAVAAVKSLKSFVQSKRDCFSDYEREGANKSGTTEYVQTRPRQRNVRLTPLDYGRTPEAVLSQSEKFRIENFLPVIDKFISSLEQRLAAYELVCSRFGFLSELEAHDPNDIQSAAKILVTAYSEDLDECLGNELVQFAEFVKLFKPNEQKNDTSAEQFMYQLIHEKHVNETFPNVEIALRIYLVLMVTNCSAERSFSKMKLIKNRLRTSMLNDRLCNLAIMSMEHDVLREMTFEDVITKFATSKARRVPIH